MIPEDPSGFCEKEETAVNQSPKPHPVSADPYPPYRRLYAWLFQAWLVMFLGVICCALVFYLVSYIP
jgi:hypothetical protein